ncbi:MAG: PD-(D/E)XK nuclease family protein [Bacteroidaceae bacterium]|nr:PD-(D/E)XK nuclease family protein [Bacteroidaceae bacterium]
MDNLKHLLQQVSEIVLKEKTLQEEKRKRGDNFNVFSVLGLQTSEVRLHSALIAELLRPDGDHGLGDKFMKAFLDVLNKHYEEPFCFDTESAKVEVEHVIGPISEDYESGGRIDLFIQDKNKKTIIIENKINAEDQYRQMSRYYKYAQELESNGGQVKLLYLTKEGGNPSDDSLGESDVKYTSINYRKDILAWLDKCLALSALYPIVRETIRQYIITLNNILSIMEYENKKEFIELLTSPNNIETTLAILENSEAFYNAIINTFIQKLGNLAEKNGYQLSHKGTEEIEICNKIWKYRITRYNYNGRYYRRIVVDNGIKIKPENYFKGNPNDCRADQPLGENYFDEDLSYWDKPSTIRKMRNGYFAEKIIEEAKSAFNRMDELSKQ